MFLGVVAPILALFLAVGNAGIPGGPMDADRNDPAVQNALNFAEAQHNRATNDLYLSKVLHLVRVQTQVVSGRNYIFTVEMVRTNCRKSSNEECDVKNRSTLAQPKQCELVVYDQPWTQTIKLIRNTCK
ncbi:cystatin C (amyloid angiopathy and cerebral hemorrhage) [Brachyhypopomus gauderio]|uniref:cystatin C (amyloid angiopathy and cerebral hemorrhage) n=1 Tax=Brachyhypopomus gauderio TaxID=698409 RepID=UPI004041B8DA